MKKVGVSLLSAAGIAIGVAAPALAHHGWAWTSPDPFVLEGTITEIYIGNPHVTLKVQAEAGEWHVDLAPLMRSTEAGFVEGVASVGDAVTLYGHRSLFADELSMKAVRVVVNGNTYDVYDDRLAPFI
ncbi:MAG: hypothetical protein AB7O56_04775 [Bauldia sp.]